MQMKSNATSPHAAWYDADSGFESTHAIEKDRRYDRHERAVISRELAS